MLEAAGMTRRSRSPHMAQALPAALHPPASAVEFAELRAQYEAYRDYDAKRWIDFIQRYERDQAAGHQDRKTILVRLDGLAKVDSDQAIATATTAAQRKMLVRIGLLVWGAATTVLATVVKFAWDWWKAA